MIFLSTYAKYWNIDPEWNEDIYMLKIGIEQQDVFYDSLECQEQSDTLKSQFTHLDLWKTIKWDLDRHQKWNSTNSFFERARLISMV